MDKPVLLTKEGFDKLQAELDELRPLLDQVAILGDHVAVPPATNANANHVVPRVTDLGLRTLIPCLFVAPKT